MRQRDAPSDRDCAIDAIAEEDGVSRGADEDAASGGAVGGDAVGHVGENDRAILRTINVDWPAPHVTLNAHNVGAGHVRNGAVAPPLLALQL